MLSSLVLLALPLLAIGQYGDPAPPDPTTSSTTAMAVMTTAAPVAAPATTAAAAAMSMSMAPGAVMAGTNHKVTVGLGGLVFNPNNVAAAIGDTITFSFHPKNHSVIQSSFDAPCYHLADASGMAIGSDSGYMPVTTADTVFPSYSVVVETVSPLWFFCSQGAHCSTGMVFAVNPPKTGDTIEAFVANAMKASSTPAYTVAIPEAVRATGSGVAATSLAAATAAAPAASTTAAAAAAGGYNYGTTAAAPASSSAATATGSVPTASATPAKSSASSLQMGSAAALVALVVALAM